MARTHRNVFRITILLSHPGPKKLQSIKTGSSYAAKDQLTLRVIRSTLPMEHELTLYRGLDSAPRLDDVPVTYDEARPESKLAVECREPEPADPDDEPGLSRPGD